ncbi:translation initiation factor SUI1 domain-containing protein, putative [Eimeria praecox]|uniref:Translation initiation factor SUI1 domain-containing protein, putative n=1 Tax=Eimeria praecox TaxID=51316 RepID=U6H4C5_9EIME|nr:translation initiation factor SUI1 domain-containing protein, putative [Eimeria praecox]
MDAHNSDDSGSGGESPELSNRARRKMLMQQKQKQGKHVEPTSDAAADAKAVGEVPTSQSEPTTSANSCGGWAHDQQPPMTGPCKVEYCPTCSMPFEYCEFSGAACGKQAETKEDPNNQGSAMQQKEHEQQLSRELEEKAAITDAKRGAGKKDGAKPKVVTVQKQAKRRGKCSTNVWGLEHFDVKQEQAAKLASKHFACGSSFQKGQPGQMPFVEIQGDVEETIAAFLQKNFNIPEDKIVFLAEK